MAGKRRSAFLNLEARDAPQGAPTEVVKAEFGRRLQRAMMDAGWSQSDLARHATTHLPGGQIGRDSISQYIRGVVLPSPKNLAAIASALGKSPSDLMPAKGVPSSSDNAPPLEIRDLGDSNVWLKINQAVSRKTALAIMRLLSEDQE